VEADLRSLNAGQAAKLEKVEKLLKDPSALPAEDPLLATARRAWLAARTEKMNLEVQLADSAPSVVAARQKERKALDRLMQEARAVRNGLISEEGTIASQRASLQERFTTIVGQIGQAEKDLQLNRELATEYENLRNKVTLRLEILKSTSSQAAVLGLQTVSAQNRMQVVDWARPARQARPTLLTIGVVSAFLSLFLMSLWVARDYAATPASGRAIVERDKVLT
jgi:hypothetical protein